MLSQIFINEDDVVLEQALQSMQRQLEISRTSHCSSDALGLGDHEINNEIPLLKQLLTCSICFTFLIPDMKPQQCSDCLNYIMCGTCIGKLNGKCSFCKKTRVKFIDLPPQLISLMKGFCFRCDKYVEGCVDPPYHKSGFYRYEQHLYLDCIGKPDHGQAGGRSATNKCNVCNENISEIDGVHSCSVTHRFHCKDHLQ